MKRFGKWSPLIISVTTSYFTTSALRLEFKITTTYASY